MAFSGIPWLPDHGIYLEKADAPDVRPARPWVQGDVFADVRLSTTGKPKKDGPSVKTVDGPVMLLGNTCSMRAGASLHPLQTVCVVRAAKEAETQRLAEGEQKYIALFPLPELRGDDLWVADFSQIGTVFFKNLTDKRIACLNHSGLAAVHRRYATHSLRLEVAIDDRLADTAPTWLEVDLWEAWNERGADPAAFQAWLNEPLGLGHTGDTTRRQGLELWADAVREQLEAALHAM
jgi:hypothetical protein